VRVSRAEYFIKHSREQRDKTLSNRKKRDQIYPEGVLSVDLRFVCADCGRKIQVDVRASGVVLDCPHCDSTIRVPEITYTLQQIIGDSRSASPPNLTEEEVAFLMTPLDDEARTPPAPSPV
jgi:DNA-directed RNA polymerase subunit RPC12/RpoP